MQNVATYFLTIIASYKNRARAAVNYYTKQAPRIFHFWASLCAKFKQN